MWTPPESIPTVPELVEMLDATVAGLAEQKKRLATLLVRHALAAVNDDPRPPTNSLLIGPTGGGKTHLAKAAAQAIGLPWAEANVQSYSATGYYGADLPEMLLSLFDPPWVGPGDKMRDAVPVMERFGIMLLDEIDKWRVPPRKPGQAAPEGREYGRAEQNELLKFVEGDVVPLSRQRDQRGQNSMRTNRILFIGIGAFEGLNDDMVHQYYGSGHVSDTEYMKAEPVDIQHYGFTMELAGRFANIVSLPPLDPAAMSRIFREHVLPHYERDAANMGCEFVMDPAAIMEISGRAVQRQVGARGFSNLMEKYTWRAFSESEKGDRIVLDTQAVLAENARVERRQVA